MLKTFAGAELMRKRFPPPIDAGYIYIMEAGDLYKIGYSSDPWTREDRLNRELPVRCHLVRIFASDNCINAEATIHRHLAHRHVYGEWFHIDWDEFEEVGEIVKMCELPEIGG